jgi:hypothetical protein
MTMRWNAPATRGHLADRRSKRSDELRALHVLKQAATERQAVAAAILDRLTLADCPLVRPAPRWVRPLYSWEADP